MIVDEAHCVWEWGESFRPDFSQVPSLVNRLNIAKTLWCSATLPVMAVQSIEKDLPAKTHKIGRFCLPESLKLERVFVSGHHKLPFLRAHLDAAKGESGMIFVSTRAAAERLTLYLHAWGFRSVFYHAGMSTEERVAIEKKLKLEEGSEPIWVVATSAFGMGMNYAFLKRCIVFDPTRTLLSLAQAVGRVGRGGTSATAQILWHENDFLGLESRITDPEALRRLREVREWCKTSDCPRLRLENYFNGSEKSGTFEE
jgi:ATP-dependent DNA helicase RecQ